MSNIDTSPYFNDPEFMGLVEFLIEKTKDVTSPMCITELARDYKERSGALPSLDCLRKRIQQSRQIIHRLDTDAETRVKMSFALSAPIDSEFLNELREYADLTLDDSDRIIEYKEKNGGLQLSGYHSKQMYINESTKKMTELLVDIAKTSDSPIPLLDFIETYRASTGATESISCLSGRYRFARKEIYESSDYDKETKIRMLFVSGAHLDNYALEELRNDAHVEVDYLKRITKYESKDGKLNLEGDHNVKVKAETAKSRKRSLNDFQDEEDIGVDEKSVKTRSGRISKTTNIDNFLYEDHRASTSERSKKSSIISSSTITSKSKVKNDEGSRSSIRNGSTNQSSKRVQSFDRAVIDRTIDGNNDDIEEVKYDRPDYLLFPPVTETHEGHTTQLKILNAINALVLSLDSKNLEQFQTKLEKKIVKSTVNNKVVPISGLLVALESCFFMTSNSFTISPTTESISLLEFLLILRNTVLVLKFDGLQDFQEKLKEAIRTIRDNDKKIPVVKVQMALQTTLDILAL